MPSQGNRKYGSPWKHGYLLLRHLKNILSSSQSVQLSESIKSQMKHAGLLILRPCWAHTIWAVMDVLDLEVL